MRIMIVATLILGAVSTAACLGRSPGTDAAATQAAGRATGLSEAAPTEDPQLQAQPSQTPTAPPTPTAVPSPTPTPSADGRVISNAYIFTRGGSAGDAWVGVVRPGEFEIEHFMDGYLVNVGEASEGRLPIVVSGFIPSTLGDLYFDQRLVLVSLPDLEVQEIAPLTPYYEVTRAEYSSALVPDVVLDVTDAVAKSIPTWSPDGRYLAFVAAIDRPSTGIYIYDSREGTIEWIAGSPNQVDRPLWSPDGRGIVYQELQYKPAQVPALTVNPIALRWVAMDDGRQIRFADSAIPQGWNVFIDWLTDDQFVMGSVPPGAMGDSHLSIADLVSGRLSRVTQRLRSVNVLRHDGISTLLVSSRSPDGGNEFSLIDGLTGEALNVDFMTADPFPSLYALEEFGFFLVGAEDVGLAKLLPDGRVEILISLEGLETGDLSPDGHRLAAGSLYHPQWLFEFKPDGSLAAPYPLEGDEYIWRPDSQAILLDCDADTSVIAQAPNWTAETYETGCPAWSGRRTNEPSPRDKRPFGILWLDG